MATGQRSRRGQQGSAHAVAQGTAQSVGDRASKFECGASSMRSWTPPQILGTHKQSTPRAGEGLSAGAARLGRAALQNHLFELQDAVVVRMLYVGMQVCMLNCGKASHITDKKRRETQQSYLIVSYNSYRGAFHRVRNQSVRRRVTCGESRRGHVPGGTIPVHWYAGRHRQLSATA